MRRPPHRLRANKCSRGHPAEVIAYDCETRHQPTPLEPVVRVELKVGYAIWERLGRAARNGGQGAQKRLEFTTQAEFWDFCEERALNKRPLWVVAHNAKNFDLAVLAWERELVARGWSFSRGPLLPTDGPGPLKVTARKGGKCLHLVDLSNWYGPTPLEAIGQAVGCPKTAFESEDERQAVLRAEPGSGAAWERLRAYLRQDVEVVLAALKAWVAFLRDHDLGNFAISLAGQAMQAFRHRFMDHEIMIHTNARALELEREAYNGALVDCYRVGEFEGEFHVLDVNSEYPFVMRNREYPVRLIHLAHRPGLGLVRRFLGEGKALIARCTIDAAKPLVPVVSGGRLVWPVGRFKTTLCTGELRKALEAGQVASVELMAVYDQAPIFTAYVDFFYGLRRELTEIGNTVYAHLCKLFMNALYGKWGEHHFEWERLPAPILEEPGTVTAVDVHSGKVQRLRQFGDACEVRSERKVEGHNSFCAVAAHATSYARLLVQAYRDQAGPRHAYYCDTDSVIVDAEGLRRLRPWLGVGLGHLKLEASGPTLRVTAPKNYACGEKVRHKGRRADAEPLGEGRYRQLQFRGLAGAFRARDPNSAVLSLIVKRADVPYSKGMVGPDGWTSPLRLHDW